MLRNTIAVLTGLAVSVTLILLAITADKHWFDELQNVELRYKSDVILYWRSVVAQAPDTFFVVLLISFGVASMIGGVVTALLVPRAKEAYAMFIGFILFFIAVMDIIFTPNHPTWYEIGIFFVFFPFSWLGGKIVALLYANQ